MRNLLALSVLFSSLVSAQTVINYEDGSTYTLVGDEQIYIAAGSSALHKRKTTATGMFISPPKALGASVIMFRSQKTNLLLARTGGAKRTSRGARATHLTCRHGSAIATRTAMASTTKMIWAGKAN